MIAGALIISISDADKTSNMRQILKDAITKDISFETVKNTAAEVFNSFGEIKEQYEQDTNNINEKDGKSENFKIDEDMLNDINSKEDTYYNNQKK